MRARIAVDAMGGDEAPGEVVAGALLAVEQLGVDIELVGQPAAIESYLGNDPSDRVHVVEAADIIGMGDQATDAVRARPEASINVALRLIKKGEASAFVTAGNTGATMAAALLTLGRIKGIGRPALGSVFPTGENRPALWLDIGANADCRPIHLVQFAHLGSAFMERMYSVASPEVSLLSIGEEESKGSEMVVEVNQRLRESRLNFAGNLEGKDLPLGYADVVVMDGFTGNVAIKTIEGIAEMIFTEVRKAATSSFINKIAGRILYQELRKVRSRLDYSEYGGAHLLGVNGICVVAHGRSNAQAVFSAIRTAHQGVESGLLEFMREVGKEVPTHRRSGT